MKRFLSVAVCAAVAVAVTAPLVLAKGGDRASKPRVAVLEFKSKADNQWWYNNGSAAAQDVFVTELVKSGKFRVMDREALHALMQEKNLTLSGDIDPKSAMKIGKLLGVNYLLAGAVTEYGVTDKGAHGSGIGRNGVVKSQSG